MRPVRRHEYSIFQSYNPWSYGMGWHLVAVMYFNEASLVCALPTICEGVNPATETNDHGGVSPSGYGRKHQTVQ
eukprot:scaffold14035_cov172-Amphora_coffeaeformis.AAC.5